MTTSKKSLLVLVVVLGVCLLALIRQKPPVPSAEHSLKQTPPEAGSRSRDHGGPEPSSVDVPNAADSGPLDSDDSTAQWSLLAGLLERPHQRPKVAEVPLLTAENEARLIELYRSIPSAWNKQHIIRILAFGGCSPSAQVLLETLTREYAGVEITLGDAAVLDFVPVLSGILARRNDDALALLVQGSNPEFWVNTVMWKRDSSSSAREAAVLTGKCIQGLCVSGRPEGRKIFEFYRDHPEQTVFVHPNGEVHCFSGGVIDAAFMKAIVSEVGLEEMMDQIVYDPDILLRRFSDWRHGTAGGRSWDAWDSQARAFQRQLKERAAGRAVTGSVLKIDI